VSTWESVPDLKLAAKDVIERLLCALRQRDIRIEELKMQLQKVRECQQEDIDADWCSDGPSESHMFMLAADVLKAAQEAGE
jgi:hypothetical protein